MILDIYWIGLLALAPTIAVAAGHDIALRPLKKRWRRRRNADLELGNEKEPSPRDRRDKEAAQFRRTFLQVYLMVMGSEWMQVSKAYLPTYIPTLASI